MNLPLQLHRRRDFTELLNAAVWYFRHHHRSLLLALVCSLVPLKLEQSVAIQVYAKQAASANYNYLRSHYQEPFNNWTLFTNTLSSSFFFVLFFSAFTTLVIALIVNSHLIEYEINPDQPIGMKRIWERVETDLFPGTGLWFLMAISLVIGFVLLVAPGIYLLVPFSIALFVHMREGKTIFQTIRRSFDLYRGHWWAGIGIIGLLVLIQLVLTFGIGLIFSLLWKMTRLPFDSWVRGPLHIITGVVESIAAAITYIALAFQYYNLLEQKEGIGLLSEVETIGQIPVRGQLLPDDESTFTSL